VARHRDLRPDTVYSHLATAIEHGEIDLAEATGLADAELERVRLAFAAQEGAPRLKAVFDALEGAYAYGVLHCVRAALRRDGELHDAH
jgi:ATP-dependent DNA helicase RecQ